MKKKTMIPFLVSFTFSLNAHAGFPQIDAPNIAANVWGNIQKMGEGIAKSGLMDQAIAMGKEMFSLENMATNNGAANVAVRQNAARQEVQNLAMAEQMQAIPNVCQQVSFSFALGDLGCATDSAAKKRLDTPEYKAFINNDDEKKKELTKKLVEDIQATYPSMFKANKDGKPKSKDKEDNKAVDPEPAPSVYSTNANALFSSAEAFSSLDYEEYSSMSDFISLIVPDYSFRPTYDDLSNMSKEQNIQFRSLEARRAVPDQALRSILGVRTSGSALAKSQGESSGNETSQIYTMGKAIKDASSESAIYAISIGDTSTPSQLYRQRVLNLVRSVELQLEQFKKGLEFEGVLATKLAYLIDK